MVIKDDVQIASHIKRFHFIADHCRQTIIGDAAAGAFNHDVIARAVRLPGRGYIAARDA